jgi:hypothetical protein
MLFLAIGPIRSSRILHVISLAQLALAFTRGWAANSPNARIRLAAETPARPVDGWS